jgi:hypothetical protein
MSVYKKSQATYKLNLDALLLKKADIVYEAPE